MKIPGLQADNPSAMHVAQQAENQARVSGHDMQIAALRKGGLATTHISMPNMNHPSRVPKVVLPDSATPGMVGASPIAGINASKNC